MLDHELAVGDRVCFEGNVVTKYGRVDDIENRSLHVAWEDGSQSSWLARQRVYYMPDEAELARLKRAFKPWSD